MKYLFLAAPLILTACTGGSDPVPLSDFTQPTQAVSGNCDSEYFSELAGVYTGDVLFDVESLNPEHQRQCLWSVDLEIAARQTDIQCELTGNITSDLLSGTDGRCGDIAQAGDFTQPISTFSSTDELYLDAVSFPVSGRINLNAMAGSVEVAVPIGYGVAGLSVEVLIYGNGTMSFRDQDLYSGLLVKSAL